MGIENFKAQIPLNFDAPRFEDMTDDELSIIYSALMGLSPRVGTARKIILDVLNEEVAQGAEKARENEEARLLEIDSESDKEDITALYRR